jgi:hypothetical protein
MKKFSNIFDGVEVAQNVVTLALTLTLSPGERGQPLHTPRSLAARLANPAAGIRQRRRRVLPLPGGEGRGEGERFPKTNYWVFPT